MDKAEILAKLQDEDWEVRSAAQWAIRDLPNRHELIPNLIQLLKNHPYLPVRIDVCETLGEIPDAKTVEALLEVIADRSFGVYTYAVYSLELIYDHQPELVYPFLADKVHSPEQHIRIAAAYVLKERVGVQGIQNLLELVSVGISGDRSEYETGTDALVKIGKPTIPAMLKALRGEQWAYRRAAAEVLGRISDPIAVPDLIKTLYEDDDQIGETAAGALGEIRTPEAVDALIKAFWDENPEIANRVWLTVANYLANVLHLAEAVEAMEQWQRKCQQQSPPSMT